MYDFVMSLQLTFGQWLKKERARQRPRMRQQDLADAIDVDRSYVVKIETGSIKLPGLETRQRIHAALGTSEDDLKALGIVRAHERVVPATVAISVNESNQRLIKAFYEMRGNW